MSSACNNPKRYLILSPYLSQSISCAKRLITNKQIVVNGGYLPDENPSLYSHIVKYYHDIIVIDSLEKLSREYDYIIPTGASSTKLLFDYVNQHQCGEIRLNKTILQSSDKLAILSLAENLGIHVPVTWEKFEDIPDGKAAIFYKPKFEGAPGDRTWAECRDRIPASVQNGDFLFQEKIEGHGVYGFGFIAEDGNILTSLMHHEMISYPVDGGSAAVICPYNHKSLAENSIKLIEAMSYTGWGLVEYKWCPRRNDFVLMEINAKMWASIELAFLLNPEFSQRILSIQTTRFPVDGLLWPDRLFRCGPKTIWSAKKYLFQYAYVYEPVTISRVANKLKNSILRISK